jgi:hypothetical protein
MISIWISNCLKGDQGSCFVKVRNVTILFGKFKQLTNSSSVRRGVIGL